jgi:acyl-CoA hydrolase
MKKGRMADCTKIASVAPRRKTGNMRSYLIGIDCFLIFALQIQKNIMLENLQERIEKSETKLFKTIFANETNHYHTLFGGTAMAIMDDIAFITGTRFCRLPLVTVATERIEFKVPVPHGSIIEVTGRVEHVGNTSIKIRVSLFIEHMFDNHREHAVNGLFTMVALGEDGRPTKIL